MGGLPWDASATPFTGMDDTTAAIFLHIFAARAENFNYRGKATSLELRLTQSGWETALGLIRALAGEAA